jgi:type VI secretion system secreted protein VgrG
MPSAKNGVIGTLVKPTAPRSALPADDADPGETERTKALQQAGRSGKYGSARAKPFKSDRKKKSWIEFVLVVEYTQPVPGEMYTVVLADGSEDCGTLDSNGRARIQGIDPGQCQITFPNIDKDVWSPA